MIYIENLESKVFDRCKKADELIVISGYIGIEPILQTDNIPYVTKVIYGMYEESGISEYLHNSVVRLNSELARTSVLYSKNVIHSKCYVWRRDKMIVEALAGSANFTVPGLNTPEREMLMDVGSDSFRFLNDYVNTIVNDSIDCRSINKNDLKTSSFIAPFLVSNETKIVSNTTCNASLVGKDDEVPKMSGINWGLANGHVTIGDAYIPITKKMIFEYPFLFPPKQMKTTQSEGKKNRQNDYIEIIWDDGAVMKGLLEGSQDINGVVYPNKISSFPKKNTLGLYLRNRLGVPLNYEITKEDLIKYGRYNISISLEGEGIYGMDFSAKRDSFSRFYEYGNVAENTPKYEI